MNKTLRNVVLVMVIVVLAVATWAIVLSMSDARRAKRQLVTFQSEMAETLGAIPPFGHIFVAPTDEPDEDEALTPAQREFRDRIQDAMDRSDAMSPDVYLGHCEKCSKPRWIDIIEGMYVCTRCYTPNFDPPKQMPVEDWRQSGGEP